MAEEDKISPSFVAGKTFFTFAPYTMSRITASPQPPRDATSSPCETSKFSSSKRLLSSSITAPKEFDQNGLGFAEKRELITPQPTQDSHQIFFETGDPACPFFHFILHRQGYFEIRLLEGLQMQIYASGHLEGYTYSLSPDRQSLSFTNVHDILDGLKKKEGKGLLSSKQLFEIKELLDNFVGDFLTVHPRPPRKRKTGIPSSSQSKGSGKKEPQPT